MADSAANVDKMNGKPEAKNGPVPAEAGTSGQDASGSSVTLCSSRASTVTITAATEAPVSSQAQTATKNLLDAASGRLRVSWLACFLFLLLFFWRHSSV